MKICDRCKRDRKVFNVTIPYNVFQGQHSNQIAEARKELCVDCIRKLIELIDSFIGNEYDI